MAPTADIIMMPPISPSIMNEVRTSLGKPSTNQLNSKQIPIDTNALLALSTAAFAIVAPNVKDKELSKLMEDILTYLLDQMTMSDLNYETAYEQSKLWIEQSMLQTELKHAPLKTNHFKKPLSSTLVFPPHNQQTPVSSSPKRKSSSKRGPVVVPTRVPSPVVVPTRVPSPVVVPTRVPSPVVVPTRVPSPVVSVVPTRVPSPVVVPTRVPSPVVVPTRVPSPVVVPTSVIVPPRIPTRAPKRVSSPVVVPTPVVVPSNPLSIVASMSENVPTSNVRVEIPVLGAGTMIKPGVVVKQEVRFVEPAIRRVVPREMEITPCDWILERGVRKGTACGKDGTDGRCKSHRFLNPKVAKVAPLKCSTLLFEGKHIGVHCTRDAVSKSTHCKSHAKVDFEDPEIVEKMVVATAKQQEYVEFAETMQFTVAQVERLVILGVYDPQRDADGVLDEVATEFAMQGKIVTYRKGFEAKIDRKLRRVRPACSDYTRLLRSDLGDTYTALLEDEYAPVCYSARSRFLDESRFHWAYFNRIKIEYCNNFFEMVSLTSPLCNLHVYDNTVMSDEIDKIYDILHDMNTLRSQKKKDTRTLSIPGVKLQIDIFKRFAPLDTIYDFEEWWLPLPADVSIHEINLGKLLSYDPDYSIFDPEYLRSYNNTQNYTPWVPPS